LTEERLPVRHSCGHLAVYLLLMEPDMAEALCAEKAATECIPCARKRRLSEERREFGPGARLWEK
jgi:hypothetical protein